MRAAVLEEYNSPFRLTEIERPKPAAGQVLVRIKASGVNPLDTKIRTWEWGSCEAAAAGYSWHGYGRSCRGVGCWRDWVQRG